MNVALHPRLASESTNIISLCTGGGGLDLGVELAMPSARPVCLVEREAFAVAHLVAAMRAGLMDEAPIWSDARTFDGRAWRDCVDGLIGGIPCQPHSLAGKRLAEEDERDLWSTARRIIVQARPWFVLIENVGGMLSSGGAERVWRDLRRLGYAVEIGLFAASEVGASHERERLFILGVDDAAGERERRISRRVSGAKVSDAAGGSAGRDRHADASSQGLANACGHGQQWRPQSDVGAVEPGQPTSRRGDAERRNLDVVGVGLADADCERLEGLRPIDPAAGRQDAGRSAGLCDGTPLVDSSRLGRGEGRPEPELRSGRDAAAGDGDIVVYAIDRGYDGVADVAIGRPIRGTPAEWSERGTLFPPGPHDRDAWQAVLDRASELEPAFRRVADGLASRLDFARVDRLRLLGNGVVPLQAGYAFRTLATRLARRSAGAGQLVRLMEGSP